MENTINDQASTLRLIATNNSPIVPDDIDKETQPLLKESTKRTRSLAISGGKGGVGKTNLAVNLALELGKLGNQVTLLDADFGLANADLLCGVSPKHHLGHVIAGVKELDDILIMLSSSVRLLPSGSGIEELANFSIASHSKILSDLQAMEKFTDFMLIDTAAGLAENVTGVLVSSNEIIIVTTPEPTAIVDAYATIKAVQRYSPEKQISVVVNNVVGVGDAEKVFRQLNHAVNRFLDRNVDFLGMIPNDSQLVEAVRQQTPITQFAPETPASRAVRLIAKQLHMQKSNNPPPLDEAQSFWDAMVAQQ